MNTKISPDKFSELGLAVIETEIQAIQELKNRINNSFTLACQILLTCEGRIIVLGMGKSGHIGNKIAATLASTGSPAFFVHPGEASHGDLGMITRKDVVLAISNSGETEEILLILPMLKRLNVPLVALAGNPRSTLAKVANVFLDVSVSKEACPLGLAPTASTTAALVMGDALAIALLEARGFTANDFAMAHPSGTLGRRLLLHVDDVMHTGDAIPAVQSDTKLADALFEMSKKGMGFTTVLNDNQELLGIFSDGDLRRALDHGFDIHNTIIDDVMTRHNKTVKPGTLAVDALNLMETHKIAYVLVVDDNHKVVGALKMHDLLRAGVV